MSRRRSRVGGEAATALGPSAGDRIEDRWRLEGRLGRGGMGEVWEAADTLLDDRRVALKLLPAILAGSKRAHKALRKEAARALDLNHPSVARVHHFGVDEDRPFVVMELIQGQTLMALLDDEEALAPARVLEILRPLAEGLAHAHEQGLVHRDVKPSNVLLREPGGQPVLIDFGIAAEARDQTTRAGVTELGSTEGTLSYMSPEQLRGRRPTPAMDVYSLAAMAYEMLCGEPPFFRGDAGTVRMQILQDEPERLEDVPPGFWAALAQGLAKEPDQRPGGAVELVELLARGLEGGAPEAEESSTPQAEASEPSTPQQEASEPSTPQPEASGPPAPQPEGSGPPAPQPEGSRPPAPGPEPGPEGAAAPRLPLVLRVPPADSEAQAPTEERSLPALWTSSFWPFVAGSVAGFGVLGLGVGVTYLAVETMLGSGTVDRLNGAAVVALVAVVVGAIGLSVWRRAGRWLARVGQDSEALEPGWCRALARGWAAGVLPVSVLVVGATAASSEDAAQVAAVAVAVVGLAACVAGAGTRRGDWPLETQAGSLLGTRLHALGVSACWQVGLAYAWLDLVSQQGLDLGAGAQALAVLIPGTLGAFLAGRALAALADPRERVELKRGVRLGGLAPAHYVLALLTDHGYPSVSSGVALLVVFTAPLAWWLHGMAADRGLAGLAARPAEAPGG